MITVTLSSCASEKVKAEAKKANEGKDEYVWVYPTGSNIPVRVKKSQMTTPDEVTKQNQDALRELQQLKSAPPPDSQMAATSGR